MYKKSASQIRMDDAVFKMKQIRLPKDNRWVQIADLVPWWEYEDAYASRLKNPDNGRRAYSVRTALGALLIKATLNLSDRETVQMIAENPAMQYLVDVEISYGEQPFTASTMVYFRDRLSSELIEKVNEDLVIQTVQLAREKETKSTDDENLDKGDTPEP
ncbi:transposase [Clostridia bacterium]|nr:transposase [Clostridia bacterium]